MQKGGQSQVRHPQRLAPLLVSGAFWGISQAYSLPHTMRLEQLTFDWETLSKFTSCWA